MKRTFLAAVLAAFFSASMAQLPAPSNGLTIQRLNSYPLIQGKSPTAPAMSPDGRKIVFGWNQTGARKTDIWIVDTLSGSKSMILTSDSFPEIPRQDDERTDQEKEEQKEYDAGIGGFQWSPDGKEIMAGPYRGRVWLIDPVSKNRRPLIDTSEQVSSPAYSPDGKYIAFLRGTNLFRLDRKSGEIKQLTTVSKGGTTLDGFIWSPKGSRLAVSWSDSSKMGGHQMMDFTKDRAEVVPIARMWNGEMAQDTQIGIVDVNGGLIKFLPDLPHYMWMTSWEWSPDESKLALFWIKDNFKEATITVADAASGKRYNVYQETAPTNYIPDFRNLFWTRDGRIMFTTDIIGGKWGYRSLMSMDANGSNLKPFYSKNHDIAAAVRPLKSDRIVLVTMERSSLITEVKWMDPIGRSETIVPMADGVATPVEFDAAAMPLMSEDGNKMASLCSHRNINPELYMLSPEVKRLTTSQSADFQKIKWAKYERVQFKGPDGQTIHGVLVTPPNLNKGVQHPAVISNMYANSAKMSWGGFMENYMATELGMVVLQIDFRASWGQGGEFNSGYANKMGIIDADEAVKGKEFLVSLGYVNPQRVGLWGWSYGGFLTCMVQLTRPGVFDTGVAVASVTDWKSYNEWYTRRRLGLPGDDKDGIYEKTSPVHHAKGLQGNLMLIHGMLDDNVLYQDTVRLQENLIKEGKTFDVFSYPRGDHGMWRVHERPHIMANILRYLYSKLTRP